MDDLISRQAAIEMFHREANIAWNHGIETTVADAFEEAAEMVGNLPAAEPIIRCRECKWWDDKGHGIGYCHAAKHGYWSEHWEISIKRTYEGNFFCADAERRNDAGK